MVDSFPVKFSVEVTLQTPLHLLIVEDDEPDRELIVLTLESAGIHFTYDTTDTLSEIEQSLQANRYDAVLSDYRLPDCNGLQVLKTLQDFGLNIPFILVSGTLGEESAVECIKSGVTDYVLKDRLVRLPSVLERSLAEFELRRQQQEAMKQLHASAWRETIINRIVQAMRETLVLEEVLQTTANQLHEALGVSRCLIFRLDPEDNMRAFHVSEATAKRESLLGVDCKFYTQYYHQLARGEQIVFSRSDASLSPEFENSAHQCSICSVIISPLLYQQSYIGGISLHQCDFQREWSEDELALVKSIADHCAIAIHQAELYHKAHNEIAERKRAEATLQQVMNSLEIRVEERTAELTHTNEQLRREILERQRIEDALRHSEERFRNLVETTNDIVWEIDRNKVYTYIAPQIRQILGYTPEELLGKTFFDLMPENERSRIEDLFNFLDPALTSLTCFENQNIHKNGSIVILETNAVPFFDKTGNLCGYRGIDRDITERKQTEKEIRKALAAEKELNELRSSFISLVSHEFRTPLTTILSSTELLQYYANKWEEERKQHHIQRIKTAVKRMTDLLEDVLTIGRAEVGKLEFKPTPIDLEALSRDLIEEIGLTLAGDRKLNFFTQGDCTGAYMDEKLIGHILNNLLSNAIKYSPNGGEINIELICQETKVNSQDVEIQSQALDVLHWESCDAKSCLPASCKVAIFRIQDKGIGIPKKYHDRLFESFHRGDNVGNIPGTGLGLAIVKKCVDLHGGQIIVDSEVGVGTTFTVTLPLNDRQSPHRE